MVCYCLQLFVTRDYVYCLQSHHRLVNDLSTVVQLTNRLLRFCLTEGLFTTKESAVHLFSSTLDPYIITSWFAIVLDEIKNCTDFKRKADCKQSSGTYLAKINPSNPPPPPRGSQPIQFECMDCCIMIYPAHILTNTSHKEMLIYFDLKYTN